jgi:hypothetical protein
VSLPTPASPPIGETALSLPHAAKAAIHATDENNTIE